MSPDLSRNREWFFARGQNTEHYIVVFRIAGILWLLGQLGIVLVHVFYCLICFVSTESHRIHGSVTQKGDINTRKSIDLT